MTNEEEKYTTLDTEQCKWWVNQLFGIAKEKACNSHNFDDAEEMQSAQDKIIKALEMVEEFEKAQIITVGRLNGRTYAYKCGLEDGKRKALEQQPSEDCVSRQAVKDIIHHYKNNIDCQTSYLTDGVCNLPSVKPISNLDKIRAEIEDLDRFYDNDYFSTNNCPMYKCNEVLLIIDKYKAESVG